MRYLADVKGDRAGLCVKLWKIAWSPVLLAALAAQAHAGPVGICIISTANGGGAIVTNVVYSTIADKGCAPGYTSSIGMGGSVAPSFIPPGQTTAYVDATQPQLSNGTQYGVSDAYSYASLDGGVLRDRSLSGIRANAQSIMEDAVHFAITNGAGSATFTFNAHLSGSIVGLGFDQIQDQFALGASTCWNTTNGSFGPCGNFGWITSSFTNQTASGFDFTGTYSVTNGQVLPFSAILQTDCSSGEQCDYSNTALFSLTLPSNLTFTSDSGVLFSKQGGSPVPRAGHVWRDRRGFARDVGSAPARCN